MSDEMMVSEKDAVLRERKSFVRGAVFHAASLGCEKMSVSGATSWAASLYPLPTTTRPRVVKDPLFPEQFAWTLDTNGIVLIENGLRRSQYPRPGDGLDAIRTRVAVWADLLANPTEEVDDE